MYKPRPIYLTVTLSDQSNQVSQYCLFVWSKTSTALLKIVLNGSDSHKNVKLI